VAWAPCLGGNWVSSVAQSSWDEARLLERLPALKWVVSPRLVPNAWRVPGVWGSWQKPSVREG
jgi:hypothetical protein